jgi:hypothetical protein
VGGVKNFFKNVIFWPNKNKILGRGRVYLKARQVVLSKTVLLKIGSDPPPPTGGVR